MIPHVLRDIEGGDLGFVRGAWAATHRNSPMSRCVPHGVYWPSQHRTIDAILRQARVIVAADESDSSHLYGCIVLQLGQRAIVHWLMVKSEYRRLGLAKALLAAGVGPSAAPIYLTQPTNFVAEHPHLVQKYNMIPSPYLLLGTHTEEPNAASQSTH